MTELVISIVTYQHSYEAILPTLNSVFNIRRNKRIIVIENSLQSFLKPELFVHPIEYIHNPSNPGFGAAHNLAIKMSIDSGVKYHLVLNPDVSFESGTVEKLLDYQDCNSNIGLIMPKVLYPNQEIQHLPKLFPTPFDLIFRKLPIPEKIRVLIYSKYELLSISLKKPSEIGIVSGCFALFRIETLKMAGLFDERFFMYFEDFDISRRMRMHGKNIYYALVSIVHHYERGANKNFMLMKSFIESAIIYFNKWGWFFDFDRMRINKEIINANKTKL